MADLVLRLIGEDAASGAFDNLGGAAKKAAAVLYDFSKDSVKAFAEAERVQRQLHSVAGDLTEAFKEQAEAMEAKLHVDAESIEKMQTLLLRYGAAPSQVEATTKAILDYSAATGVDATSATMMLVRGVETGTGSLGKLGIQFDATKNFATDLGRAVDQLSGKFGGAADDDANSLHGRMEAVSRGFENVQKAWGSLIAGFESKFGVLDKIAQGLEAMSSLIDVFDRAKGMMGGSAALFSAGGRLGVADALLLQQQMDLAGEWSSGQSPSALPDTPITKGIVKESKGGGRRDPKDEDLEERIAQAKRAQRWRKALKEEEEFELDRENEFKRGQDRIWEQFDKAHDEHRKQVEKEEGEFMRVIAERNRDAFNEMARAADKVRREMEREQQRFQQLGQSIGNSFLGGIDEALNAALNGGQSAEDSITNATIDVFAGILQAVATYYGGEFVGQAAGIGIKYGSAELKKSWGKKHDGGWIEKFHGGGWPGATQADEVPAVLQTGERVLSRSEVARMGGQRSVDAMAGGRGGGMTVHVQAFDSAGVADFFGDRGGRGFINALRAGRGNLIPLLGRG